MRKMGEGDDGVGMPHFSAVIIVIVLFLYNTILVYIL